MLRKLEQFKKNYNAGIEYTSIQDDKKLKEYVQNLVNAYFSGLTGVAETSEIKSVYSDGDGGVLGRNSFCYFRKRKRSGVLTFLKVNVPGQKNRAGLQREYEIYSVLYEDIALGFYDISNDISVLEMKCLRKALPMNPNEAKTLIDMNLKKVNFTKLPMDCVYDVSDLLHAAKVEVSFLYNYGFIGNSYAKIEGLLEHLSKVFQHIPRVLCHGDYGDVNVLANNNRQRVIIDWEDVFYGIEGYDFLYWLTFFNHRKYYCTKLFESLKGEYKTNMGILIMILLIKEAMSVYNGEFKRNQLTAEERIEELLDYL